MDKIVDGILSGIPAHALNLTLSRSTIRQQHSPNWFIDKTNTTYDLVICLSGEAHYQIGDAEVRLKPGHAMLIPPGTRFRGENPGKVPFTGIAQHFSLSVFDKHDLLAQMDLQPAIKLSRWPILQPLVQHYRSIAPATTTTLTQHHLFMFFLISFIDDAFLAWRMHDEDLLGKDDALALSIMVAATQISAAPLQDGLAEHVVERAPYNTDYFQREFRKRIGWTPRKYQEFKRMERAMLLLESGRKISEVANEIGYQDVYYFSRMFKRYVGTSPRGHISTIQQEREGIRQIPPLHHDTI